MPISLLPSLLFALFAVGYTPGPANLYSLACCLKFGRRKALKMWRGLLTGFSNLMTSRALARIAETGGPRCCKRDSYNAILAAIDFVEEKFDIKMETPSKVICARNSMNNHCLKSKCPFNTPSFTIPTL